MGKIARLFGGLTRCFLGIKKDRKNVGTLSKCSREEKKTCRSAKSAEESRGRSSDVAATAAAVVADAGLSLGGVGAIGNENKEDSAIQIHKMSSGSSSCNENSFDSEELFQIRNGHNEVMNLWRDSQSQSFELIRRLELRVKTLSDAQTEDKKRIEQLERELNNCSQEKEEEAIRLSEELKISNSLRAYYLQELENKEVELLKAVACIEEEAIRLNEELKISNSLRSYYLQELENKEVELLNAVACIDELEKSISSRGVEYHCEMERMKLELLASQQNLVDARKSQNETALKNDQLLKGKIQNDKLVIEHLKNKNKNLSEKLWKSEMDVKLLFQKVDEQLQECLVVGLAWRRQFVIIFFSSTGSLGPLIVLLFKLFSIMET